MLAETPVSAKSRASQYDELKCNYSDKRDFEFAGAGKTGTQAGALASDGQGRRGKRIN